MKKKIDLDDELRDLSTIDKIQVVESLKKYGNKAAVFDSNYSKVMFYSYFMNEFYKEKNNKDYQIVANFLKSEISKSPNALKKCINIIYDKISEIDCYTVQIFKETTIEVIVGLLFNNLNKIIYDEFYLFSLESPTLSIIDNKKISTVQSLIYEIIYGVAGKLKVKEYDCDSTKNYGIDYEYTEEDEIYMKTSPKNLTEAVDYLLGEGGDFYQDINFDENEKLPVYVATIFNNFYHILYFKWYLEREDSPLRVFFKEHRNMTDPHYITYYIIENFITALMIKKSINYDI